MDVDGCVYCLRMCACVRVCHVVACGGMRCHVGACGGGGNAFGGCVRARLACACMRNARVGQVCGLVAYTPAIRAHAAYTHAHLQLPPPGHFPPSPIHTRSAGAGAARPTRTCPHAYTHHTRPTRTRAAPAARTPRGPRARRPPPPRPRAWRTAQTRRGTTPRLSTSVRRGACSRCRWRRGSAGRTARCAAARGGAPGAACQRARVCAHSGGPSLLLPLHSLIPLPLFHLNPSVILQPSPSPTLFLS